jgi:hypothetical protein
MKVPLSRRYAEARAEQEAAVAAPWEPGPGPREKEPEPGLWVEAFMNGLKGDPDPTAFSTDNQPAPAEADDEGDLK